MYAKLIIYQEETALGSNWQSPTQTDNHTRWQLTADNLTTGKIAELLLCLDELGFSDESDHLFE